jgi:hypothetical protein
MRRAFELKTIGLAALMGVALTAACGDDDDTSTVPTGPSGPTTTTTSSTGGSGGSTTTTTSTGGTGGMGGMGSGGGQAQTCANYCALQAANCTGDDLQYSTEAQCLATCALLPVGTAADTAGNTLGCRIYHSDTAGTAGVQHCSHGGPHGGPADDAHCQDTGDDQCDVFCALAVQACPSAFTDEPACLTACGNFAGVGTIDADYKAPMLNIDSFACRFYHLTVATDMPTPHCTHIAATSSACNQ